MCSSKKQQIKAYLCYRYIIKFKQINIIYGANE